MSDVEKLFEGCIELVGEDVHNAATKAQAHYSNEYQKAYAQYQIDCNNHQAQRNRTRELENYEEDGQSLRDFNKATELFTEEVVQNTGFLSRSKKVRVFDKTAGLNYLKTLVPDYWTESKLEWHKEGCPEKDNFTVSMYHYYGLMSRYGIDGPTDDSVYYEKFLDLKGRVFITLSDYQLLKQFM